MTLPLLQPRRSARAHRALRLLPILWLSACATGATATGSQPAAAQAAPEAALAWLLSDEVLVLPLQSLELRDAGGGPADSLALRRAFDAGFQAAVSPALAAGRWVWPPALLALRTRNPTAMPDPARLSIRGLRPRMPADAQLTQDLGSEIRAILALSGARRYVLLPLRLTVTAGADGAHGYDISLLAIDSRRAIVRQSVAHGRAGVGTVDQAVAAAVAAAAGALVPPEQ